MFKNRDTEIRVHGFDSSSNTCCFPGGSEGKVSAYNVGDLSSIPRSGRSPGLEDPLEKAMETHSSILAWRIPWTEEPGGLQFMRSQRVRQD